MGQVWAQREPNTLCSGFSSAHVVFALLVAATAALLCGPRAALAADLISASRLETCTFDGTVGVTEQLTCSQKLVMALSVDSGDAKATSTIELTLSCINSPTGVCPCPCDYATELGCTCRDLTSALRISLVKSPVWAAYPVQYLQPFNWKPTESVVRPGSGECLAGEYDESPTCGWYYMYGVKQPDSQGFSCECTFSQIWDETFGTNTERTRANLDCDFFSNLWQMATGRNPCSAHCLIFDPVWAGGYALGSATLHFEIGVQLATSFATVAGPTSGGTSQQANETITVSPVTPIATSEGRVLLVKLLGDLSGYSQLPVLSDKILFVPSTLQDLTNADRWMLLDRSRISFSGSECDKVGTSFSAFRNQPNGCGRAPGTCLKGQLGDLYNEDDARVKAGLTPLYSVKQYAYGTASAITRAPGSGDIAFSLPITSRRSSVVTIEVAADSMRFITNASPGRITAARMCTFDTLRCGGFEALSARGYLWANITNTGAASASYTLSVTNCSQRISPIEAQRLALDSNETLEIVPFQVYVQDSSTSEDRYCWLVLYDSVGRVSDKSKVPFFTNATQWGEIPTGGYKGSGSGVGARRTPAECRQVCGNAIHNIRCLWRNKCWGRIGAFFGLLGGLVGAAIAAAILAKMGLLMPLLSSCFSLLTCAPCRSIWSSIPRLRPPWKGRGHRKGRGGREPLETGAGAGEEEDEGGGGGGRKSAYRPSKLEDGAGGGYGGGYYEGQGGGYGGYGGYGSGGYGAAYGDGYGGAGYGGVSYDGGPQWEQGGGGGPRYSQHPGQQPGRKSSLIKPPRGSGARGGSGAWGPEAGPPPPHGPPDRMRGGSPDWQQQQRQQQQQGASMGQPPGGRGRFSQMHSGGGGGDGGGGGSSGGGRSPGRGWSPPSGGRESAASPALTPPPGVRLAPDDAWAAGAAHKPSSSGGGEGGGPGVSMVGRARGSVFRSEPGGRPSEARPSHATGWLPGPLQRLAGGTARDERHSEPRRRVYDNPSFDEGGVEEAAAGDGYWGSGAGGRPGEQAAGGDGHSGRTPPTLRRRSSSAGRAAAAAGVEGYHQTTAMGPSRPPQARPSMQPPLPLPPQRSGPADRGGSAFRSFPGGGGGGSSGGPGPSTGPRGSGAGGGGGSRSSSAASGRGGSPGAPPRGARPSSRGGGDGGGGGGAARGMQQNPLYGLDD